MEDKFDILLYAFLIISAFVFFSVLWRYLHARVWIKTCKPGKAMYEIGFLEMSEDGNTSEVHLEGGSARPIGRVINSADGDAAQIFILSSSVDDDTAQPDYRLKGYVTDEGLIYRQLSKRERAVCVGYMACPSKPNIPTIHGERTWHHLWLASELNAYLGKPKIEKEKVIAEESNENGDLETTPPEPQQVNDIKRSKNDIGDGPQLVSCCSKYGVIGAPRGTLTLEARACGYSVFYRLYNRNNYSEYYKDAPYNWKDTALLSAIIYSICFMLLYFVNTCLLKLPLLGNDFRAVLLLLAFYPLLWAIVRLVKIDRIENGRTFQPQLDLLNKSLNVSSIDTAIFFMGLLALYFTYNYYDYDFIPLIVAIMAGVMINGRMRKNREAWLVQSDFKVRNEEEEETETPTDDEIEAPRGEVAKTFMWDLDPVFDGDVHGNITIEFSPRQITELRQLNPYYSQRFDDRQYKDYVVKMYRFLRDNDEYMERTRFLAQYINKVARKNGMGEISKLQFALDFVQKPNIESIPDKESKPIHFPIHYVRYPDEVMYDQQGDSDCKSMLAAMLFHAMGYNVLYLYSRGCQHAAVAVQPNIGGWLDEYLEVDGHERFFKIEYNLRQYIFCETSEDNYLVGQPMINMDADSFDTKIDLPLIDADDEENNEDIVARVYQWDLDSLIDGHKLHGVMTLYFDKYVIEDLRSYNPFVDISSGGTYEQRVRDMVEYLRTEKNAMANLVEIAEYIKEMTSTLPEIDRVQFALDFVQTPNIQYCVDEESAGINYAHEYMRFPDETLYDKEGDCDCKSFLALMLFHCMGYNALFMISEKEQHAAIAIEVKPEWMQYIDKNKIDDVTRMHNGRTYLFCETTSDGMKVGQVGDGSSIKNFDKIVEVMI